VFLIVLVAFVVVAAIFVVLLFLLLSFFYLLLTCFCKIGCFVFRVNFSNVLFLLLLLFLLF